MNPEIIHLPFWYVALVLTPAVGLALAAAGLRRVLQSRQVPEEDPDWSVPPLIQDGGSSIFHRWDVRCKILALLAYAFCVASLQHLLPSLIAVGVSGLALAAARTPVSRAVFRLLAICGFLSMLLVVMPFSAPAQPGDVLIVFGGLQGLDFNLRGLNVAGTIAAKGVAIALLSEPLLNTAPLPVTLQGLTRLGVPKAFSQMVLLCHRYVHVFRHEARRMSWAMAVRGFRGRTSLAAIRAVANFLGMLFVRSFERTERVMEAMQARGYQGEISHDREVRLSLGDVLFTAVWFLFGIGLAGADRLWI
jgi:cobalt/nickel transport system permease protein